MIHCTIIKIHQKSHPDIVCGQTAQFGRLYFVFAAEVPYQPSFRPCQLGNNSFFHLFLLRSFHLVGRSHNDGSDYPVRARHQYRTVKCPEIPVSFQFVLLRGIDLHTAAAVGSFLDNGFAEHVFLIDVLVRKENRSRIAVCLIQIAVRIVVLRHRCDIDDSLDLLQAADNS